MGNRLKTLVLAIAAASAVGFAAGDALVTPATQVTASAQGPIIPDGRYVTVTAHNAVTWRSFSWNQFESGETLYGHTFLVKGQYRHQNGSVYLSLYDASGRWHGYINQASVRTGAKSGQQGAWLSAQGYATLLNRGRPIYQDFSRHAASTSDAALRQTFKVTGEYHWFDGTRYVSLYRADRSWLGYMAANDVKLTAQPQGAFQTKTGWVRVTHAGYQIWKSFGFTNYSRVANGTALRVNGEYHHSNGSVYDSLYDLTGHWLGYMNVNGVETVSDPLGPKMADNRYVTLTAKATKLWADPQRTQPAASEAQPGKTYRATAKYQVIDGTEVLRLEDNQGQLVGYVNAADVSVAAGPQGSWRSASGYVTVDQNTATYSDFSLTTQKKSPAAMGTATYKITGQYATFSGQILYSLYDVKNRWQGYVDAGKVKVAKQQTGSWLNKHAYLTTTKKNQPIWQSFFGSSKSSSSLYQQTFEVRGQYKAFTGATYYSLYRTDGAWVGYLNAANGSVSDSPQGAWMSHSGKVQLAHTGYPVWHSFFADQAGSSTTMKNQVFSATGMYRHFNGSLYYSLYDGKKWVGYVNAQATSPWSNWQSVGGSLKYLDDHTLKATKTFSLKYYSQLDKQWANVKYGSWTFGKTGCGQATMAMIISGFGQAVTPKMTGDYAHAHGTFDREGPGSLQSDLTRDADHWNLSWKVMSSQSELASYLAKGYPASVCLDFGSYRHIVALTGYTNGYTTVHDPWSGLIYNGRKSLTDIWKRLSWLQGNHDKGASAATVYIAK